MTPDITPVSLFCAPDEATFAATCADLRNEDAVLFEAATVLGDQAVPFVICGEPLQPTILLGAPLDQQLADQQLQQFAQSIIDFHRSELIKRAHSMEDQA